MTMIHNILIDTPVRLIDNTFLDHLPIGINGIVKGFTECGNGDGYPADQTYQIMWSNGQVTDQCFELELEVIK
jgi:hypothetical protein